ncbi:glycogenin-2 isoform d, partial [Daubentonia madagascariensis]
VDQAFVTLATNDIYCQGALVLGQSLRSHRLTRKLVVLITPQVSSLLRVILSKVFDEVIEVNLIDSEDYIHLAFLKRPELGVTLSKLHCWTLTSYSKCVFLDADTLVDLAISVSKISIEEKVKELSPEQERRNWEEGHIDYMGKDAFARIQEKLDRFLQ